MSNLNTDRTVQNSSTIAEGVKHCPNDADSHSTDLMKDQELIKAQDNSDTNQVSLRLDIN